MKRWIAIMLCVAMVLLVLTGCSSVPKAQIPFKLADILLIEDGAPTIARLGAGITFDEMFPSDEAKAEYDFSDFEMTGRLFSKELFEVSSSPDLWQVVLTFEEDLLTQVECCATLSGMDLDLGWTTVRSIHTYWNPKLVNHFGLDVAFIDINAMIDGTPGLQEVVWELDDGARVFIQAENITPEPGTSEYPTVVWCSVGVQF